MLSLDHEEWAMGRPAHEMLLMDFDRPLEGIAWTKMAVDAALDLVAGVVEELVEHVCFDLPDDHRFWAPPEMLNGIRSMLIERKLQIRRLADEWLRQ